jgi:copper oxidase (laccase) domain-containing protein
MKPIAFETFPPLAALPGIRHAFSLRTDHDTRAETFPADFARQLGYRRFVTAEQPHANVVALVHGPATVPGADALITRQPDLLLIIRCADCPPVFLVDRRGPAIALIHSGKKGTLANIVGQTRRLLPDADFAFIGPSIGPCHYDLDLWQMIETQLTGLQIHNPRCCTACRPDRYYSYRAQKGQTGRHLAVLAIQPSNPAPACP